jgi:hypothetical protein
MGQNQTKYSQISKEKKERCKKVWKSFFWEKWAQVTILWMKKSKIIIFREKIPTSHQIIGGTLLPPSSPRQIWTWLSPLGHDCQPTHFTHLLASHVHGWYPLHSILQFVWKRDAC